MNIAILICLSIIIIIASVSLVATAYALILLTKYLKNKDESFDKLKYRNIDVTKIDKIFDDIIEREFNDYHRFHPELSQEGSYIKRDEIHDIVTTITTRVYNTITPAIRYNIGLIYDISTDEKLINLIGEKIGVLVMAMAATINSSLIDDTRINIEV